MQAQHYTVPFHHQPVYDSTIGICLAPDVSSLRLSTDGLNHAGFSRGSPQTYLDYDYFPDRGDPSRLFECSSSPSTSDECATGVPFPGISCPLSGLDVDVLQTEGIPDYHAQQRWQWSTASESFHGVTLSSTHKPHRLDLSAIKSSINHRDASTTIISPAAQLPTPASMAILLNPNAREERQSQQVPLQQPASRTSNARLSPVVPSARQSLGAEAEQIEVVESASREKKHGCTMCHKR